MNYGSVELTSERRHHLLRDAILDARAGDLLFFYHRTSWRSRWIRRICACDLPHVCVYLGNGRIIGMLRGRVRRHFLRRFFRDEYELRFVRGSSAVLDEVARYRGRREAIVDLVVLAVLVLVERVLGARMGRRLVPYRMRGVTCSGIVSSAWHTAHGLESWCDPMQHTPLDLERAVGKVSFFEASLIPRGARNPVDPSDRNGSPRRGALAPCRSGSLPSCWRSSSARSRNIGAIERCTFGSSAHATSNITRARRTRGCFGSSGVIRAAHGRSSASDSFIRSQRVSVSPRAGSSIRRLQHTLTSFSTSTQSAVSG
jgi:hypothetical protein